MRNRCILSLLLCGLMLYIALPRLSLHGSGLELYFSWGWLVFIMIAIAGNLAAILYVPPKHRKQVAQYKAKRQRVRQY